jgi:N-methylhydantoinase A
VRDDFSLPALAAAGPAAAAGTLRAYFKDAGLVELARYERGALPAGQVVAGPALIEDEWSTTLVYPGQRCQADRLGNLLIERDGPSP